MKALNLYILSRYTDVKSYTEYYRAMAEREKAERYSKEEMGSLRRLVDLLLDAGAEPQLFENFFYGFVIPQIGKEFDILKIGDAFLLNIELKSRMDAEKARAQLLKNQFYLRHLSDREQSFITFDAESGALFALKGEALFPISADELICLMKRANGGYDADIERYFSVSQFLVSPLNTPERFLKGEYFLTLQQQEIKDDILRSIGDSTCYYAILGGAGTGKTLLLYDIAKSLAARGKVGIIHCGQLSEGHASISDASDNIDIFSAVELKNYGFDTEPYAYFMIDEAQRIHKAQFERLLARLASRKIPVVLSFDPQQTLARSEAEDAISDLILGFQDLKRYELTGKIRTNPSLAAFIAGMGNSAKINRSYAYHDVDILYANTVAEAKEMIELYRQKGYLFINHTPSLYTPVTPDSLDTSVVAHKVIGQEFDNVLVMMDDNFYYEEGKLHSKEHPYPNYLYHQMLFQEVTRVRERLAVIVIGNPDVFSHLLRIKTGRSRERRI